MARAHAPAGFVRNQNEVENIMKKLSQLLAVAGLSSALLLSVGAVNAQDNNNSDRNRDRSRGNFDPTEIRQRMMENIRDQMKVTDDKEWKILEDRINKVMDARRDIGFGGSSRLMRRPGGDSNNGGGDRRGGFRGFGGEPSAEQQALDKAIDSNASKDALKDAMAKARAAKKAKEDKLAAAQEELKKVLSTQQEAVALSMGLVN